MLSVLMRKNRTCRRRCSAKSQSAGTRRFALPAAAEDEPPGAVKHAAGAVAAPGELAESAGAGSALAPEPGATEPDTAGLEEIVAGDPGLREAGRPFDSVLLLTEETREELVEGRPPLPMGADQQHEMGRLFSPRLILAAYCNNGHCDDLEARFWTVCGISMNQQTFVPRPPFGPLFLDGGDVFQRAPTI